MLRELFVKVRRCVPTVLDSDMVGVTDRVDVGVGRGECVTVALESDTEKLFVFRVTDRADVLYVLEYVIEGVGERRVMELLINALCELDLVRRINRSVIEPVVELETDAEFVKVLVFVSLAVKEAECNQVAEPLSLPDTVFESLMEPDKDADRVCDSDTGAVYVAVCDCDDDFDLVVVLVKVDETLSDRDSVNVAVWDSDSERDAVLDTCAETVMVLLRVIVCDADMTREALAVVEWLVVSEAVRERERLDDTVRETLNETVLDCTCVPLKSDSDTVAVRLVVAVAELEDDSDVETFADVLCDWEGVVDTVVLFVVERETEKDFERDP